MSQRDDYEPGVPCWVDTLQPEPEAAMAFYGALFGWEFAGPGPGGYSVAVLPAGRLAIFADPAGAVFGAWEPRERKGAQLINEPGAWAMSHLETPDPDGAAAFYAAVFGWTTETFGEGAGAFTMFRLPGYVGGDPRQPVSRDVVATMAAMRDDGAPRWNVNLCDHDVDATAAKAVELGGSVVVAPFDTPMTRTAVLADPHGATLTINNVPA